MVAFKGQDAEPILSQGRWEKADLGEEHIRPFMPGGENRISDRDLIEI